MTLLVLGTILGLLVFAAVRATWTPVAPLRLARRRSWGQIISASGAMYVRRPRLFLGIGVLLIPFALVITLLQWLAVPPDRSRRHPHRPGRGRVRIPRRS